MLDRRETRLLVDQHLRAAADAMPARLRRSFGRLVRERGLVGADPDAFPGPLEHPVLELPVWVADRLDAEGTGVDGGDLADVLGVSILGYLHVRAHDDWLDSAARDDPALVALAEALLAACDRLLGPVVGPSRRFWQLRAEVLTAYGESLLQTQELRSRRAPVPRAVFEELLAQSRPLVLPSAALLDRAGRWELLPALEEFVFAATAAAQLVNDLTDVFRDRRNGHRTWTLQDVGESAADGLWTEVAGTPRAQGRIHGRVAEALRFHERSALAARELVAARADAWLTERRAALEGLPAALHDGLVRSFVRRLGAPDPAGRAPTGRARP
ncbi:hypothetical protein [Geodermatophilus sp. SYSU D00815]